MAACRRTSAVFARSDSTKLSLLPLSDFSSVGSPTARRAWFFTSMLNALPSVSDTSASEPCVRSSQSRPSSLLSTAEGKLRPPASSRAKSAPASASAAARRGSVSGRSTSSAASEAEIIPSIQQTKSSIRPSAPTRRRREEKSAQRRKQSSSAARQTGAPYAASACGCEALFFIKRSHI